MEFTVQDIYNETNQLRAVPGEPRTKLAECLEPLKKNMLSLIASNLALAGRSSMKKQELASALSEALLDPDRLLRTLFLARREERGLFQQLLKQPVLESSRIYPAQYLFLQERGAVFTYWNGDKLAVLIPEEIQQVYRSLELDDFWKKWERRQLILDYILAAVHLYGACERGKLLEIFNSQNAEAATADEMDLTALKHLAREQMYSIHRDYWISSYFRDEGREELPKLLEGTRNKPYYIPDKAEFLRYADDLYTPNTLQLERLKAHVLKHIIRDRELADILVENIQAASSMEAPLDELLDEFAYLDIEMSEGQIGALLPLLVEVHNNTRMWINRGFTPVELRNHFSPERAPLASRPMGVVSEADFGRSAAAPKVGRNDPCPCGSGKKHKKCCGAVKKE